MRKYERCGIIAVILIACCLTVFVPHFAAASPRQQTWLPDHSDRAHHVAVDTALDRLVFHGKWDDAAKIVARHLGTALRSRRFYELSITILSHQGRYDDAAGVAQIAHKLYPDYLPFLRDQAFLKAERGQCAQAQILWQAYQERLFGPARAHEVARFNQACDFATHHDLSLGLSAERAPRTSHPIGESFVTAQTGSYLFHICESLSSLCPNDYRFQLDSPPPPRSAFVAQYHLATFKRVNWRHALGMNVRFSQHIGGYQNRLAALSGSWRYRRQGHRIFQASIGASDIRVPRFGALSYIQQKSLSALLSYQQAITPDLSSLISVSHISAQSVSVSQKHHLHEDKIAYGLSHRLAPGTIIGLGVEQSWVRPSHHDVQGLQQKQAYHVS